MSSIGLILFYVVLIAGMWFLLWRPQKKETEESAGDARRYGDWRYSTDNQRILRSYH